MIVMVTGMPRSGSTFSFNVVRDILRTRGTVSQYAGGDLSAVLSRAAESDHVVVKAHLLDPGCVALIRQGAVRTVTTLRRVEDAVASWFDVFDAEQLGLDVMRGWLRLYPILKNRGLEVQYDLLDRHPWRAAWKIARYIDPRVSPLEVTRVARRLRKDAVKRAADAMTRTADGVQDEGWSYYSVTDFFHRRHVSSLDSRPAEQRLKPEVLERVRQELGPDMRHAGLG